MKALREGISVMDQELRLSDVQLHNRKVTAVSTMHPLFLAQNLTQIICMLEGLRRMENNWVMSSYARNTAVSIWCQLSQYARERIRGTLVDLMGLDAGWYERISHEAEMHSGTMFYNEAEASDQYGLLMYAMKGGITRGILRLQGRSFWPATKRWRILSTIRTRIASNLPAEKRERI